MSGLYLRPIEAGRDGEVAQLVKDLMTLAVDRIVTTEELLRVRIVELHGDAAGCVAVSCRVYQVDAVVAGGVAPAARVRAHRTVLHTVQKRRFGTQSFKLFLQSSEMGLTPPPPPLRFRGRGGGESQFRRWDIPCVIYIFMYFVAWEWESFRFLLFTCKRMALRCVP